MAIAIHIVTTLNYRDSLNRCTCSQTARQIIIAFINHMRPALFGRVRAI